MRRIKEFSEGEESRRETARSNIGKGVWGRRSVGEGVIRDMARRNVGGGDGVRFRIPPVGSESLIRFPARLLLQLRSNPQLSLLRRSYMLLDQWPFSADSLWRCDPSFHNPCIVHSVGVRLVPLGLEGLLLRWGKLWCLVYLSERSSGKSLLPWGHPQ